MQNPSKAIQPPLKRLTLADIPVGRKVVIESLPDRTAFGRRLMEIGLLPGNEATVMGRAPLRDPIQICVFGALLAIRRSDALAISVSLLADAR
jgi:ferrous iron transport protein A